jgi:hypothetical protein
MVVNHLQAPAYIALLPAMLVAKISPIAAVTQLAQ